MHIDDVERHECTVNSNELAVHARALQRSKHLLLFTYRENPSVCPHCLGNNIYILQKSSARKKVQTNGLHVEAR